MPRDYTYYSYKPDYGFELYKGEELVDQDKQVKGAVCFARVFRDLEREANNIEYTGTYTLKCRKEFVERSGNFCVVDKSEIRRILRYMRDSLEVEISMEDTPENYVFHMKVEGKPIKHKFALTFLRVFYEFPYNEFAKEAFRLRDTIPSLKHVSFLKIYYIVVMTFQLYDHRGHSLFSNCTRDLSINRLRKAYKEGKDEVQQVYTCHGRVSYNRIDCGYGNFHRLNWEEGLEDRFKIYSDNFKKLKNEKGIRRRARKAVRKVDK